jgi:hypothetical protein
MYGNASLTIAAQLLIMVISILNTVANRIENGYFINYFYFPCHPVQLLARDPVPYMTSRHR